MYLRASLAVENKPKKLRKHVEWLFVIYLWYSSQGCQIFLGKTYQKLQHKTSKTRRMAFCDLCTCCIQIRVARFVLGKTYQNVEKYTYWPWNTPNGHKIGQYFPFQGLPELWFLVCKYVYLMATLIIIPFYLGMHKMV
jgi:hypothetical protein